MIHSLSTRSINMFGAAFPDRAVFCTTLSVAARIFLAVENPDIFRTLLAVSLPSSYPPLPLCDLGCALLRPYVFYDLFHLLLRRAVYLLLLLFAKFEYLVIVELRCEYSRHCTGYELLLVTRVKSYNFLVTV